MYVWYDCCRSEGCLPSNENKSFVVKMWWLRMTNCILCVCVVIAVGWELLTTLKNEHLLRVVKYGDYCTHKNQ